MKKFSIWSLLAAGLVFVFGGFWYWHHLHQPIYGPDFEFKAQIISTDNFYSSSNRTYQGEVLSKTLYSFRVNESIGDSVLLINNSFEVRKPSGQEIFKVKRQYGINPKTGLHLPQYGDQSRNGYFFAPPNNIRKVSFDYWHINYDQPLKMGFLRSQRIQGLKVDCYQATFQADQTKNLHHLSGVPERKGVELDVKLTIWVEPLSGQLIKYTDVATAWYYDIVTHKRLHPWNHFKNEFEELSISRQVAEAKIHQHNRVWNLRYIPWIFLTVGLTILLIGYKFRQKLLWRMYFSVGLVAAIGIAFSILFYQSVSENNLLKLEKDFDQESESVHLALKREIEASLSTLYPVRSLFHINPNVSEAQFSDFVGAYLERQQLNLSVAWAPLLHRDERAAYEAKIRQNGRPDFCIYSELLILDKRCTGDQLKYCPVTYIEPKRGNFSAVGYDLLSDETRRQVLSEASSTGEISASTTITLVQDRAKNKAILLALPVSDKAGNELGYVTAPIRITDMFSNAFSSKQANPYLQVVLRDAQGDELYRLYDKETDVEEGESMRKTTSLQVGNKIWKIDFISLPSFGAIYESSFQHFILFGGITLSCIIALFFYFLLTDNRKALTESNKRLEAELQERQRAEEKLVEIEQFAYIASHDLQEPLRTIRSYLQLIQENFKEDINEEVKQFMNTITDAAKRMQLLITDLLNYSKLGKEEMKQSIDCNAMVDNIKKDLAATLEESNAVLKYEALPIVEGFRSGLHSVFLNLINNAVKFQQPGNKPEVIIRHEKQPKEVLFSISDNGIGIEKKHFNQIFVIFRRLYHQSEYSGTGIGLAQCKKIIELHGGRIWLESEPGKGTTFYFTIPNSSE